MHLYASVYMCRVVTCWERADLLALVCGVQLWVCCFPIGFLGQMWYLIVSIPDLCTLLYFNNETPVLDFPEQDLCIHVKLILKCFNIQV